MQVSRHASEPAGRAWLRLRPWPALGRGSLPLPLVLLAIFSRIAPRAGPRHKGSERIEGRMRIVGQAVC